MDAVSQAELSSEAFLWKLMWGGTRKDVVTGLLTEPEAELLICRLTYGTLKCTATDQELHLAPCLFLGAPQARRDYRLRRLPSQRLMHVRLLVCQAFFGESSCVSSSLSAYRMPYTSVCGELRCLQPKHMYACAGTRTWAPAQRETVEKWVRQLPSRDLQRHMERHAIPASLVSDTCQSALAQLMQRIGRPGSEHHLLAQLIRAPRPDSLPVKRERALISSESSERDLKRHAIPTLDLPLAVN